MKDSASKTSHTTSEYLRELLDYFSSGNQTKLRDLSNRAIEGAAFRQNKQLVEISLIAYSLSKLISKPHLLKSEQWTKFRKHIIDDLSCREELEQILHHITQDIAVFDIDAGNYITDVVEKARIKQASRVYALGLSLSEAAQLTSVSKSQLLGYIGATKIHDRPYTKSRGVAERFKTVKKLFEGK